MTMVTDFKPGRPSLVRVAGYGDAVHLSFNGESLACNTSHVYQVADLPSNFVTKKLTCGHCKQIARIEAHRLEQML